MFFCQEMKKGEKGEMRDTGEMRENQNKHIVFPESGIKKHRQIIFY